mgnify:FL=1|tara:strand:- start:4156 stop:4962 length:807 start_codon:yes stop_codon:yes gene_type:complete
MARITIPEFKSGEPLDTVDFNTMDTSLLTLKVDEENLAIEGINQRTVAPRTVFDNVVSNSLSESSLISKTDDVPVGHSYPFTSEEGLFNVANNKVVFNDIASTEDVLIRVSCRVFMKDFGARTFKTGDKPPWVALILRKLEDGDWTDIPETWQHFALAFTGKIDGFSAYKARGAGHLDSIRNAAGFNTDSSGDYDLVSDGTMFDYEFSYTSAYLYRPGLAKTNIQFSLWGVQQGPWYWGDDVDTYYSYPEQTGFFVKDYNIHAYKIKR